MLIASHSAPLHAQHELGGRQLFVWDGSLHFFGDTTGGLSGSTFTIRNARPGTRLFYRFEAETVP